MKEKYKLTENLLELRYKEIHKFTFCHETIETIEHTFRTCHNVTNL